MVGFRCSSVNDTSDEMENQEAVRLAKQTDPSGIRTIGSLAFLFHS